ncbi:hypothetical protein CWS72_02170 [Telmatospirillum siberiense]|uniref:Glycosyltransferase family 9 protein n=1 Tax=Telmatospirillum siberiense TaxID=382514 RepID=A0A2N3PZY8_9PROT|nr:hypothetical protein CWS72_02170 [Telmatospirillum siberiense]
MVISTSSGRQQRFDFRFSQGTFGDEDIFDSALSVPGRYLVEVARRLRRQTPEADWFVVGNPLLPLRTDLLAGWLDGPPSSPVVATDRANFPVFYVLPRRLFDDAERFLLLLSALDATLDACLLTRLLGETVSCRQVDLEPVGEALSASPNGWVNGDQRLLSLKLQCGTALKLIEERSDWRTLPFATFYPMHAGDVLFVSVASRMAEQTFFGKHVVCSSYMDIPAACGSRFEAIRLDLPWIPRDGSVSELTYFSQAIEKLGSEVLEENVLVFSRILRLYYHSPFHLVDQARFALGESLESISQTVHGRPAAEQARCRLPTKPLRVLFHLNGGWSLKTYPLDKMRVVIGTLRKLGVEVSVLSRPDLESAGAVSLESKDSETLRRLIEEHHLFVGVDSFPHHFSTLVAGWPTIGLFGNTKPCNSDSMYRAGYRSSDLSLSCNRCGAYDGCPVFGTKECLNYAPPAKVVTDIFDLARETYGYEP